MGNIIKIEEKLQEKGISSNFTILQDYRGVNFKWEFYKDHYKCGFNCTKKHVDDKAHIIITMVIDYFNWCNTLAESIKK